MNNKASYNLYLLVFYKGKATIDHEVTVFWLTVIRKLVQVWMHHIFYLKLRLPLLASQGWILSFFLLKHHTWKRMAKVLVQKYVQKHQISN